jgi:hypothetical protein
MKTRILVLASCLLAFASQAQQAKKELWKWTDSNGVVHYSDVPGPGAVKVDLSVTEGQPRPTVAAPAPVTASSTPAKSTAAATVTYTSLEIWQPENGASFFGADATVNVRLRSEPQVSSDDSLLLFLDGKLVEGPTNAVDYTLSNLERGAHSVTAQILDVKGKEKIRSQPVVFHIKQVTTIAPRAVGPNVKPPPNARPTPRGG